MKERNKQTKLSQAPKSFNLRCKYPRGGKSLGRVGERQFGNTSEHLEWQLALRITSRSQASGKLQSVAPRQPGQLSPAAAMVSRGGRAATCLRGLAHSLASSPRASSATVGPGLAESLLRPDMETLTAKDINRTIDNILMVSEN